MKAISSAGTPGSSPRAWGIREKIVNFCFHIRFIPTCVGNTRLVAASNGRTSVHPHVRGEYIFKNPGHSPIIGSSPRAWGIHARPISGSLAARFIPTCVGNTVSSFGGVRMETVHPHVRGEYHTPPCPVALEHGSSPRAWGIPIPVYAQGIERRFIPTCVGNTTYNCENWKG